MFLIQALLYFTTIHCFQISRQNNLHYTDPSTSLQYNCLHVFDYITGKPELQRIVPYCMNEYSPILQIQNYDSNLEFTFTVLKKEQITSEQLYRWSAPIDLIEHYQYYLDTNDLVLADKIYLNCSWPRFGPLCQYEICQECEHLVNQSTLTCYLHLQCDHQSKSICLDWKDICNGRVDCSNDAIDEKYCLEMEVNQCQNDEYRCLNGQCIPKSFQRDNAFIPECFDQSDEVFCRSLAPPHKHKIQREQRGWFEDMACMKMQQTRTDDEKRKSILLKAMFSIKEESIHDECWSAFKDLITAPDQMIKLYGQPCLQMNCLEMIEKYCPDMLFIPSGPVLFNDIYLAYRKIDAADYYHNGESSIHYICTNNSHYFDYFFKNNYSQIVFQHQTCFRQMYQENPGWGYLWIYSLDSHIDEISYELNRYVLIGNYTSDICNRWHMYQCQNSSKCISIYRIKDSVFDCPYKDDENDKQIMSDFQLVKKLNRTHFKCSYLNIYISFVLVNDRKKHCRMNEKIQWWEDENTDKFNPYTTLSFQTTCNGFTELIPQLIDGRNETDETECEYWPCDNVYSHCNGLWECPQGIDEIGCFTSTIMNCSSDYQLCLSSSSTTFEYICLPKEKIMDGNIDCIGGTDEPQLCEHIYDTNHASSYKFNCVDHSLNQSCFNQHVICDNKIDCYNGSDEYFCTTNELRACDFLTRINLTDQETFLCQFVNTKYISNIIHFHRVKTKYDVNFNPIARIRDINFEHSELTEMNLLSESLCLYGLVLNIWLNDTNNSTNVTCLCPPQYYGNKCQYQNQRIFLTIQFRAQSDSLRTVFTIVISLIDDSQQRIVHSYEQFTFVSVRDCGRKYYMYLVYSTRSKDSSKTYSIHIDFFEKQFLKYRGSVLLSIQFPFLPVHRLAFMVPVPKYDENERLCSNRKCKNGKCTEYANLLDKTSFCRCDPGWTGHDCSIKYKCTCGLTESCIGISAQNRSICACPINKFGPRCLLTNTICQSNNNSFCNQHGSCLPNDDNMIYNHAYTCICSNGYTGKFCEISDQNLTFIFNKDIILSSNVFIHLIQVREDDVPLRSTLFRTFQTRQNSISVGWTRPFHIVFAEFEKKYYLVYLEQVYDHSLPRIRTVQSSNRCPNITELFNQTILQLDIIRRIKYYHLPCQDISQNLSCFHDLKYLCLCETMLKNRVANCFEFDHEMKYDCQGQNECEYNAACLQDDPKCPTKSMCICPSCYYGSRCQFSTSSFGLSLDAILGYHILPEVALTQQSSIIQFSLLVTIIFFIIGLINGILCILTFKNHVVLEVGCGLYLLCSSITTLLTMIMFTWKFFVLLLTQMTIFSNQTFLLSQCYTIDVLLRIFILLDQWLNTCVAIERTITVIKGINFNKKASLKSAKIAIVILCLMITATSIHDPFYRNLITEQDENYPDIKRKWCIVRYSSNLQYYNSIIQSIHFIGSFVVNILSAIIVIVKKSRQEQILHPQQDFRKIVKDQIEKHRSILTSPLILVILALPRLIIIFVSKCMQSTNNSWLYLIGYFISFLPVMLTFIIFVVPSTFYRAQCQISIDKIRTFFPRFHR